MTSWFGDDLFYFSFPIQSAMMFRRSGFTLVELLVTIAIIGVLISLAAPGVQAMRESSRRAMCQSNLIPIGMAIQSYHDRWEHFPVGTSDRSGPISSRADGVHHNWIGRIMNLMDQPVIAASIDRSASIYDSVNSPVLGLRFTGVNCPSAPSFPPHASDYVGMHHPTEKPIDQSDHGIFVLNTAIDRDAVSDGQSNTIFVSEKQTPLDDLGWLSGTRATIRNVGGGIALQDAGARLKSLPPSAVGSIGSFHPAGVHALFGSGEIQFLSAQIDTRILQQMVDRRDGGLPLQYQTLEQQRRRSVE